MKRTLVLALGLMLALVAVAVARTTIHDANDTKGKIDIKSATFSKTKSGKFKFVVVFYEKVPPKGETGNELLEMWKKKPHAAPGCGGCFQESPYQMQGPQTGKQPVRTNCGEESSPCNKTGTGTIKRKDNKLTFTVPRKAIGKPKDKFFWRVRSFFYGNDKTCPQGPCEDRAPDGSKVVKETL